VIRRAVLGAMVVTAMFSSAASAQQQVPVVLNHLTLSVDSATYHDIAASPFLRNQFAFEDSTTKTADLARGLTLWGKYNFFTLEWPGRVHASSVALAAGEVHVVLGIESGDGAKRLQQQRGYVASVIAAPGAEGGASARRYDETGSTVLSRANGETPPRPAFWVIQYGEAALRTARGDSLSDDNFATSRFLAGMYDPKKLFNRVTGATIAIPVGDIRTIVAALETDGTKVAHEGEAATIFLDGFTLHLVPSFIGAGVKQLQFALNQTAVGNPIYQFGPKSQLRFGPGPIAVWNFNWP
jgi:Family of unknown function (DUF5829)